MTSDLDREARSPASTQSQPESVRRAYLRPESNVKSIGQLCYLVCFFSALGALEFFLFARGVIAQPPELKAMASPELIRLGYWFMTGFFVLFTIFNGLIGRGLIHLRTWARWTVVIVTAMSLVSNVLMSLGFCLIRPMAGLLSLGLGIAVHALILYPLLTPAVGFVFSGAYREVIRETPGIRSRMHWLLKLLIGMILAGVLGILGILLGVYLGYGWADWLVDRFILWTEGLIEGLIDANRH